jgi:tetratricopeptide (TPR) repeat protein
MMDDMMEEESAHNLLKQGLELLDEGEPAQAAMVLERARLIEPSKGSILEALGRAYYSYGRFDDATACFEEALEVDPTNDYAHYCLGLCYLKLRRKSEAAGHFKMAWSLHPHEMYRGMAHRFGSFTDV